MTHVFEGTAEEISNALSSGFAGRRLRVTIEDDADLTKDIPMPPIAIRNQDELEELLAEGLNSLPGIEYNRKEWDQRKLYLHLKALT